MPPSPITALSMSLSLSLPLFLLLFSFIFLRIFFFPLLLLQFGFYTFIINDDFGLGLIKGSDFGRRKQKFGVKKMVILGRSAVFASLQHLLLLLPFSISVWLFIYEFVYGFDEFGSRFRMILMILGVFALLWWWLAILGCSGGG